MSLLLEPRPVKAATGAGVVSLSYDVPLWSLARNPQKLMTQAQALYHDNPWVRLAERTVSGKGGSVPYHLEDGSGNETADTPQYAAIRDLLEKPQAALPAQQRQPSLGTRRAMWSLTLRHMGLCGTSFWYLDQTDALAGIPLAILYLNPARMFPVESRTGQLLGWSLDKKIEEGGTPLELRNVLPFYLDPPDSGPFGIGLVESAGMKAHLATLADRHMTGTLAAGGRLSGIVSPKKGSVVSDDQWKQFVSDYRNIVEFPDAAKRLQIAKGPIDYVRTVATNQELDTTAMANLARDDILTLWGVPGSQVGIAQPAGLNSGGTKSYDEAVLWQGAIHTRLQSLYETVQYGLFDRYKTVGIAVELVIEEPEFDDDAPAYDKATKAQPLPLTNDERRALVGLEPLEDANFGAAVFLPSLLTQVAGPGYAEQQAAEQAARDAQMAALSQRPPTPPGEPPVKALIGKRALTALRRDTDEAVVPRLRASVSAVLSEQKASIVRHLRHVGLDHLRAKPTDLRWDSGKADSALIAALRPHVERIAHTVGNRAAKLIRPGKADPFLDAVMERVLQQGALRVTGINKTTRDAIAEAVAAALEDADTIEDVIRAVEALSIFDADRAEVIARTESMFAYNSASLGSFAELGVDQVQAIDGDGDPECAARDGQVFSLAEADAIEDHPNGTLDWIPVLADEPAPAKALRFERDDQGRLVRMVEE